MVTRAAFLIAALFASGASFAASPLIEESVGERDQDDAALEEIVIPIDLTSASAEELAKIPFWSLSTVQKWLELRTEHAGAEWTWEILADSLRLQEFQLEQLRDVATLGSGLRERALVRLTLEGDGKDNLTGLSSKLRARQEIHGRSRVEMLAVRRANDPRMIDDLHVTLSGLVKRTSLRYSVGTFQLDWGLGLLSSRGFGSARAFTSMSSMRPEFGTGIVSNIPSSEYSWRRGAALEYERRVRLIAGANAREWNAQVEGDVAELSGSLSTESDALGNRDRLGERSGFFGAQFAHAGVEGGALFEASTYEPELVRGMGAQEGSMYAGVEKWGIIARGEGVRADGKLAACGALSRGTDRLAWTLYSMYAEEGYAPLRGQGWRSYGEAPRDTWRRGMRAGWWRGSQRVYFEVRDESESGVARGETEARWFYDWSESGQVHVRGLAGVRDDGTSELQRSYRRVRVEGTWKSDVTLAARAEIRDSRGTEGGNARHGSYMYVQAESKERALRFGLRLTKFDLSPSDGSALVYEHDLVGAYPIQILSGNGMRAACWFAWKKGLVRAAAKAAIVRRVESDTEYEFGVEATFAR